MEANEDTLHSRISQLLGPFLYKQGLEWSPNPKSMFKQMYCIQCFGKQGSAVGLLQENSEALFLMGFYYVMNMLSSILS